VALSAPMATRRASDLQELYRWAVQDPRLQVTFLALIHHHGTGRWPRRLREDFAGNAADAVDWLALGGERAIAVDIDARTLRWGARRARRILGPRADRLQVVEADVRTVGPPRVPSVDVVAALNFSALVLHERRDLFDYFRRVRRGLRAEGVFVMNVFGGPARMRAWRRRRTIRRKALYAIEPPPPAFEYIWEQLSFDPLTARLDCRLHFVVRERGRRRIRRNAFRYDCRLWTVPELRDLLREAGFRKVEVWQHRNRGRGGVFEPTARLKGPDWVAYVVGRR
jgi:SAM-dependent methyltransferase